MGPSTAARNTVSPVFLDLYLETGIDPLASTVQIYSKSPSAIVKGPLVVRCNLSLSSLLLSVENDYLSLPDATREHDPLLLIIIIIPFFGSVNHYL